MNLILAHAVFAEKRGAEQAVNRSSSESRNATGKCRKSSLTPPGSSYRVRSGVKKPWTASSTRTAGEATMGWWTWATKSISRCIMVMHEFAPGNCHINGIESFWSYAKRRLAKFNAVPRQMFLLYIKECEFRFHHREEDLSDRILNSTERKPTLKLSRP